MYCILYHVPVFSYSVLIGLALFIWIAHINVPPLPKSVRTGSCSIDFLPVLCFEALVVLTFFKLKVLF